MRVKKRLGGIFTGIVLLLLAGCAGTSRVSNPPPSQQTGEVFSLGTDAPPSLPNVVSFEVMISGVTVNNAAGSLSVLANPTTVDFAKYDGLHELLDLEPVPVGTYSSVTITGSSPVIGYLDTTQTPPALNTITNITPGTFTVTVNLAHPLSVDPNDMVGLLIEMDLRQTIQSLSSGSATIRPTFDATALTADDSQAEIDEFRGGVVSVDVSSSAFTIEGVKGRQWNVATSAQTNWDAGAALSNLTTNSIVEISGKLDAVTHGIDADEVEVLSENHFFLGGLVTYVHPATPNAATAMDLYTRAELPDLSTFAPIGQINALALDGSESYYIADFHNPLSTLLFSNWTLAPGQRVAVGGAWNTSGGTTTFTVHRVVLERQGQEGTWVVGSTQIQSGSAGTFALKDTYLAGVLLPSPVTVVTTNFTNFVNLGGLSALTGTQAIPLRVVGFVLVDPKTNQPVIVARRVEELP